MRKFFPEGVKAELLEAALVTLLENWPASFSMAQIARRAKTSKPRLAYHFESIDEIVIEIAKAWAASGKYVTTSYLKDHLGDGPQQLIELIFQATFKWWEDYPQLARVTPCLIHLAQENQKIAFILNAAMTEGRQRMNEILRFHPNFRSWPESEQNRFVSTLHLNLIGGFLYFLATQESRAKMEQHLLELTRAQLEQLGG